MVGYRHFGGSNCPHFDPVSSDFCQFRFGDYPVLREHSYFTLTRGSSVSEVNGDRLDDQVQPPAGAGIFLFSAASRPALETTQPPIQRVPQTLSPGIKRREREADHVHL
jgi:hypothetical protein